MEAALGALGWTLAQVLERQRKTIEHSISKPLWNIQCLPLSGDGCVSMAKNTGQVSLTVTQRVDFAEVLLLFRSSLGGGVYPMRQRDQERHCCGRSTEPRCVMQLPLARQGRVPASGLAMVVPELYIAGFFDAKRCIRVRPLNVALQLRMDQVNP